MLNNCTIFYKISEMTDLVRYANIEILTIQIEITSYDPNTNSRNLSKAH